MIEVGILPAARANAAPPHAKATLPFVTFPARPGATPPLSRTNRTGRGPCPVPQMPSRLPWHLLCLAASCFTYRARRLARLTGGAWSAASAMPLSTTTRCSASYRRPLGHALLRRPAARIDSGWPESRQSVFVRRFFRRRCSTSCRTSASAHPEGVNVHVASKHSATCGTSSGGRGSDRFSRTLRAKFSKCSW